MAPRAWLAGAIALLPFVVAAAAIGVVCTVDGADPGAPQQKKTVAPEPPPAPKAKEVTYEPWELVST